MLYRTNHHGMRTILFNFIIRGLVKWLYVTPVRSHILTRMPDVKIKNKTTSNMLLKKYNKVRTRCFAYSLAYHVYLHIHKTNNYPLVLLFVFE
jgi:hypothetical protein